MPQHTLVSDHTTPQGQIFPLIPYTEGKTYTAALCLTCLQLWQLWETSAGPFSPTHRPGWWLCDQLQGRASSPALLPAPGTLSRQNL